MQPYVPNAADWIGALEAGQKARMVRQQDEARQMIGGAMARGDYQAAAQAAFGAGEYQAGSQIEKIGAERAAAERRAGYGAKLKEGDVSGAAQDALAGGDLDYYKELDSIADAQKLEKAKAFGGILRAIGSEPEDVWDDLIAANRAKLQALDIPAQEIDFFIQASPEQRRVLMAQMLSRADMLDSYLKQRFDERKFTADQEARLRDDKRADAQLAISRGRLGVDQGNLAQRRREHEARERGVGGYGVGGYDANAINWDRQ